MSQKLLVLGGVLSILGAFPHALLGWPLVAQELRSAAVDPNLIAALAIGWHFGSVTMFALGLIVLAAAPHVASQVWAFRSALIVGLSYAFFGLAALALRFPNPHFLVFVAVGALIAGSALRTRKSA